jgi:hypothetical protein
MPFGSFIVILSVLWAGERVVTALINRGKPVPPTCECMCCTDEEEEDDDDVVVKGGRVEEHEDES